MFVHRSRVRLRLTLLVVGLLLPAVAAPAAQAAPFPCDGTAYVVRNDASIAGGAGQVLKLVRQPDGTFTLEVIGEDPTVAMNAVGFCVQDGYMYAIDAYTQEAVRIDSDGAGGATINRLGPIAGLPAGGGWYAGTFLRDGRWLVASGRGPAAIVDVSGPTPTVVQTLTYEDPQTADFAVSPDDDKIYGSYGDGTYEMVLEGAVLRRGPLAVAEPSGSGGGGGGQFFDPTGRLVIYHNGGSIRAVTLPDGPITELGPAPPAGGLDATACANTVSIAKDVSPRTVDAGQRVTYTYTLSSLGDATNTMDFADTLPPGMTYVPGGVTVSPASGSPNAYGNTNRLTISDLTVARNASVTITAVVQVANDAPGGTAPNQATGTVRFPGLPPATVVSDDPTTASPNDPTNALVVAAPPAPPPAPADLEMSKRVSHPLVQIGSEFTWTLRVVNHGPGAAPGVRITDQLPDEVQVVSAAPPQGACTIDDDVVRCDLGPMAAGAEVEVPIRVRAIRAGTARNVAVVEIPPGFPPDPAPANNQGASPPTEIREPLLQVSKTASRSTVGSGDAVSYRIRVRNSGRVTVRDVRVCDQLPSGLSYIRSTPRARRSNGAYCWTVGRLRAGSSRSFRLVARALGGADGRVTNRATASSRDARTGRARRTIRVRPRQAVLGGGVTG